MYSNQHLDFFFSEEVEHLYFSCSIYRFRAKLDRMGITLTRVPEGEMIPDVKYVDFLCFISSRFLSCEPGENQKVGL